MPNNALSIPVLILFGPTASGKTGLLLRLFEPGVSSLCAAEVVSADSMQVYRGMDIGTAKPTIEERAALPHHLIDIHDPHEQFNVGDFVRRADAACVDIARRGRLAVVSGGAGFYLKNFILGLSEAPPSDGTIRLRLKQELRERGAAVLMEELALGDPVSAGRIHLNDEYRLLRALEVLRLCGRPLSSFQASGAGTDTDGSGRPGYRFLIIGLSRPREELYRRINLRCAAMFREGLPGEVRRLYEAGYTPLDPGLRAIGYREFFVEAAEGKNGKEPPVFRFLEDFAGVEALVARNSRRYAKRQAVFFASIPGVQWVEAGGEAETAERIRGALERFL
ncbi:MAG: tRNA (adenosine(37)-N6)-dimethylallyltransferase MiaA [Treponema sp.]|jgi:tRNA dimethylallyltransferase|nr:tRNA (adenosine(37)-N6)-dimethylallyltransferase MiaA [Treponema sp.]